MNLPLLEKEKVKAKKVIVRADLDVDLNVKSENLRLKALIPTLRFLYENAAKVIIIGHRGRPHEEGLENLSLEEVCQNLSKILAKEIKFINQVLGEKVGSEVANLGKGDFLMLENLRFDKREEANDEGFAKELANLADVYINESFAASHRLHASIIGIPKFIPSFFGFRFIEEVKNLSRVFENPVRPVIAIISGVKKDKLDYIQDFEKFADKILIAGRLPEYLGNEKSLREFGKDEKVIIANLIFDKEDITPHSVQRFKEEIAEAKTIVLAGVLGKYEDQGHRQATKEIFTAVSESSAFKVVGGGHSLIAIEMFDLTDKFNWVSVGGGAMLEYLAKGTLPGIEALIS